MYIAQKISYTSKCIIIIIILFKTDKEESDYVTDMLKCSQHAFMLICALLNEQK